MPAVDAEAHTTARARWAVSSIFFVNGFVFASWVPHIPGVKARHALSDASLGLVLLAMAVGAVLALTLAGGLVGRLGSKRVTSTAALGFSLLLPLPIWLGGVMPLALSLVCFGALNATLDVAMNAQAVAIERRHGRSIMSSFHGLFSLGGLIGAGLAGLCLAAGLSSRQHVVLIAIGSALWVWSRLPALLDTPVGNGAPPVFVKPTNVLLGLGALAFAGLLVEGAMADWTAVYLRDTFLCSPARASLGFAAFSLTMAAGRFAGDRVVNRLGAHRVLRYSGWIAAAGLGGAVVLHDAVAAIIGFALVGLGTSNIIPILFSAAGRVQRAETAAALAAVATTGYLGFLAGPPLVGFVAQWAGMSMAIGLLAILCVFIALCARTLTVPDVR